MGYFSNNCALSALKAWVRLGEAKDGEGGSFQSADFLKNVKTFCHGKFKTHIKWRKGKVKHSS